MTQCAYPLVKQHLTDRLALRAGLAGVVVSYQAPEQSSDVRGDSGQFEGVFLDTAEGDSGIEVFTDAQEHHWTDDFNLTVVAQVLDPTSDQETVDARCGELVAEILGEIGDPDWRSTLEDLMVDTHSFDYVLVTPVSQRWVPGYLPGTTGGHGARCELALRVEARRAY